MKYNSMYEANLYVTRWDTLKLSLIVELSIARVKGLKRCNLFIYSTSYHRSHIFDVTGLWQNGHLEVYLEEMIYDCYCSPLLGHIERRAPTEDTVVESEHTSHQPIH